MEKFHVGGFHSIVNDGVELEGLDVVLVHPPLVAVVDDGYDGFHVFQIGVEHGHEN